MSLQHQYSALSRTHPFASLDLEPIRAELHRDGGVGVE
jgi:hypothetical protein